MSHRVYALKTDSDRNRYWKPRLVDSVSAGTARFGWSWYEGADLNRIRAVADDQGWEALSEDDEAVWGCSFLLRIEPGDYLVYINLPEYGQCTLVQAAGGYQWSFDWEDFNHKIPVDPKSIRVFDRNDSVVHPSLARRLKLQGRWWEIRAPSEFQELLAALETGAPARKRTPEDQVALLARELEPILASVADSMRRTHPAKDLEGLVAAMLERVPGVLSVERFLGRADRGADLMFEYETGPQLPGLQSSGRCAVQVKAYEGEMGYQRAIEDLRRAFKHDPSYTAGLVISTALSMSEEFEGALQGLREQSGRPVSALIGPELAQFFLRHS